MNGDRDRYLNRPSTRFLTYQGITLCLSDFARALGMNKVTLWSRLNNGWSIKKAIETEVRSYNYHD